MRRFLLISVSTVAMIAGGSAHAQSASAAAAAAAGDGAQLGEVVVTARRRAERLDDVPIAASVATGQDLLARGSPTSTGDVLEGIAGLNVNNAGTSSLTEFTIRGSGAALTATGGDSGVGVYRNGIFAEGGLYFGHNYGRADFFDVEQVEVLRGTQGALYGRDAVGGSVNVISARPAFNDSGRVDFDYGATVDKLEGQAVVNHAINDSVAVRVGADIVDQQGGFIYDRSNGKYADEDHGGVVRAQVRFLKGPLDANLLVERQEENSPFDLQQADFPKGSTGFASGYANARYVRDSSIPPVDINNVTNIIMNSTYRFDFATLSVNSSYRDLYTRADQDADLFTDASYAEAKAIPGNTGNVVPLSITRNQDLYIQVHTTSYDEEAHLAGGNDRLTWLVGGEYLSQDSSASSLASALPLGILLNAVATEKWTSYAGYGSLGYDFIPKVLNLTVEGRYTDDTKDEARFNLLTKGYDLTPTTYRQDNFSYDATLGYHLPIGLLAYAKVGTGYRVGGANTIPYEPVPPALIPQQLLYNDETSFEYEFGLKGSPTRQTFVGAAIYHTTTDGVIVSESDGCTIATCGKLVPNFLTNAGTADAWGIELEGKTNFDLLGGHAKLAATLSHQSGTIQNGVFKGFRLPQEPDWIESFDVSYVHPFVANSDAFINIDGHGQSGGTQDVSTPTFSLDPRFVANIRFGVRRQGWEVAGYVYNVFNDEFRDSIAVTSNIWDMGLRSAGVQVRYHW